MPGAADPIGRRCRRPVVVSGERYDVFGHMHWVCFHYEFERGDDRDPDQACRDPSCPSRMIDPGPPADWLAERGISR